MHTFLLAFIYNVFHMCYYCYYYYSIADKVLCCIGKRKIVANVIYNSDKKK